MRTSSDDREHAVDILKAAFVQGRLTKDELDFRAGQAFASLTYADLDAVTSDIPAGVLGEPPAQHGPSQTQASAEVHTGIRMTVAAGVVAAPIWVLVVLTPTVLTTAPTLVGLIIFLALIGSTAIVMMATIVTARLAVESRRHKRDHRGLHSDAQPGAGRARHIDAARGCITGRPTCLSRSRQARWHALSAQELWR